VTHLCLAIDQRTAAILLVLCLSANTSFADFPSICRTVSQDGFLPLVFAVRGRRLVYTQGIKMFKLGYSHFERW
jgi:hypothetical protein